METTQAFRRSKSRMMRWLTRGLLAFFAASFVLFTGFVLFLFGTRLFLFNRALPGVHIQDITLSGMSQEEIIAALNPVLTYAEDGDIALLDADRTWLTNPAELGVSIDLHEIASNAFAVGRQGTFIERLLQQVDAWYQGYAITPVILFDQVVGTHFLQAIASTVDQPTIEAALQIEGTQVLVSPGQIGRSVDIIGTLDALKEPFGSMHDAVIPIVIEETHPVVLDASSAAESARKILSEPLRITAEGAEDLVLEPSELAPMIRFEVQGDATDSAYAVKLDPELLATLLAPRIAELERKPENARFIFNDETRELDLLQPAVIGRTLDVIASIETINAGLREASHAVELTFEYEEPLVGSEATAQELGISEAVSVVSTYFPGSSSERIQNIETASSIFHGLLIPPGETLSMAGALGDISLDNGYAEALIILGDRTIKGVGGGVCQVSTTLFRAVFFGGFEIVERHPHAYRVGYYEGGPGSPGPGLDATVFVPLVDFKFRNDTPNWLLMETYIYGNQLLWKFYSTSDGRTVQWSSHESNQVDAPKPLYKENPDLDKDEIKKIDYEADGLDVVVYRTVTRDGETIHKDTIKTHYLPWRAIYEFGPGSDLPNNIEVEEKD
ncbi:MAG: VanW family protein [Anaerolineales bacterium]